MSAHPQAAATPIRETSPLPESMRLFVHIDEPGVLVSPGYANTLISIHMGRPVHLDCKRGGKSHSGTAIHGDIEIVPPGTPAIWENREKDTSLICSLPSSILHSAAAGLDLNPDRVEIRNRFQARDPQIEHIGWALKAEMEYGYPSGRLYIDSLAMALAARLLRSHSSLGNEPQMPRGALQGHRLKRVLAFIEENLSEDLTLESVAAIAGVSAPHCKVLFRRALGVPVHQYVVSRRIDRAVTLLRDRDLPLSRIALDTGFAHQSHMARHMRRTLGISPLEVRMQSEHSLSLVGQS